MDVDDPLGSAHGRFGRGQQKNGGNRRYDHHGRYGMPEIIVQGTVMCGFQHGLFLHGEFEKYDTCGNENDREAGKQLHPPPPGRAEVMLDGQPRCLRGP